MHHDEKHLGMSKTMWNLFDRVYTQNILNNEFVLYVALKHTIERISEKSKRLKSNLADNQEVRK